jgi:hypothetical protein
MNQQTPPTFRESLGRAKDSSFDTRSGRFRGLLAPLPIGGRT